MATEKQIRANRENAKKGGVKTVEGKKVARWNALRHGLLSRLVVIETEHCKESRDVYDLILQSITDAMQPIGAIEEMLVERIVTSYWRLRRVLDSENDTIGFPDGFFISRHNPIATGTMQNIQRYETHIDRCMYRAIHELQRLQAARRGESVTAPIAVEVNTSGSDA
jgi:hypothetical protein